MNTPLVTIGVTAFNAEENIERAINSALNQTWRPVEIVAVNDCSTDKTGDVLDQLNTQHQELRVFHNDSNGGVAVARNMILENARGEFVCFFDDDDESLPERILTQLERIISYENEFADGAPVICHAARKVFYLDGHVQVQSTMGLLSNRLAPNGTAVAERVLLGRPLADGYGSCPTCSQMARLETYQMAGGFDPDFRRLEDTELIIRWAMLGCHFVGVPEPLVNQKMIKTATKSLQEEARYAMMVLEKHKSLATKHHMFGFCKRWIRIKQAWLMTNMFSFSMQLIISTVFHPLLTGKRLFLAIPNIGVNKSFSKFHSENGSVRG